MEVIQDLKFKILLIGVVFFASVLVYYWPVYYKGYPVNFYFPSLVLAKNLALTGQFKVESPQNVVLSSQLLAEKAQPATIENKLTALFYAWLFKKLGFNPDLPIYVSVLFFSLTNALLFLLVWQLFCLSLALIFSGLCLFLPLGLRIILTPGLYELASFCLAIALVCYFSSRKKKIWLGISGVFFALSFLARNSFLLSFFPFVLFDFYRQRSFSRLFYFGLPFLLIIGVFLGPDILAHRQSAYLSNQPTSFAMYGHLFPDPYTFHLAKENYLEKVKETTEPNFVEFLLQYHYPVNLRGIIGMYLSSLKFYLLRVWRLTIFGGPLIIAFLLLGGWMLYQEKREIFYLFITWLLVWYFLLVALKTNNANHYWELQFLFGVMIASGIFYLLRFIYSLQTGLGWRICLICFTLFLIFNHLILTDKEMFHLVYQASRIETIQKWAQAVKASSPQLEEVIAVDKHQKFPYGLNYYTDFSFVFFSRETIKELAEKNQLQAAFEYFGVKKVVGYSSELNQLIQKQTNAEVIPVL